jgi:hypothetical protein
MPVTLPESAVTFTGIRNMPCTQLATTDNTSDAEVEKESDFVVNRVAIDHDGILFDKGGEALVVEVTGDRQARGRC